MCRLSLKDLKHTTCAKPFLQDASPSETMAWAAGTGLEQEAGQGGLIDDTIVKNPSS